MARTGRPPKPTALKLITGNPGKRALNQNEPKPTQGAPLCPSDLDPEAKREWRRVVPELDRIGMLAKVDRACLVCYCETWALYRVCQRKIVAEGPTYETDYGPKKRPEVAIASQCLAHIRAFCAEFGLTPSSRGRMKLPGKQEVDPFDEFLKGAG